MALPVSKADPAEIVGTPELSVAGVLPVSFRTPKTFPGPAGPTEISRWWSETEPPDPDESEFARRQVRENAPPMPSTHLSLHYHLVFSTKNREAWFTPEQRARVHRYLLLSFSRPARPERSGAPALPAGFTKIS